MHLSIHVCDGKILSTIYQWPFIPFSSCLSWVDPLSLSSLWYKTRTLANTFLGVLKRQKVDGVNYMYFLWMNLWIQIIHYYHVKNTHTLKHTLKHTQKNQKPKTMLSSFTLLILTIVWWVMTPIWGCHGHWGADLTLLTHRRRDIAGRGRPVSRREGSTEGHPLICLNNL